MPSPDTVQRSTDAYADLLDLANDVVGFCVALREDHACWRDHPDAGVLFEKACAAIAKAKEIQPERHVVG